jgi:poly(3-hydroxybutyrate) depolymerase
MTATDTDIRLHRSGILVLLVGLALLAGGACKAAAKVAPEAGSTVSVTSITIDYRAYNGRVRHAEVLLPSWYSRRHNPALPLVISPHGRGGQGSSNARFWGTLPTTGGFAVVNPDGMGRRLARISYGYRGQIDDLARMPAIVEHALPWVHVDRGRVFALGSSMGGQETLLLVARHPQLLAGAAALDSVTDMTRRYGQLCRSKVSALLQTKMRRELGGTPSTRPVAYAARSPLAQADAIAASGVPLQIWWSTQDRIVIDQAHQSGALFRTLRGLRPHARVKAVIGSWEHSTEMRSTSLLPLALSDFGLLPHGFHARPGNVHVLLTGPAGLTPAAV